MRNFIALLGLMIAFCTLSCSDISADKVKSAAAAKAPAPVAKTAAVKTSNTDNAKAVGGIQVDISSVTAKKGAEACVTFKVSDFQNILGYQHSIQFDAKALQYAGTKNYGLPNLTDGNFGTTKSAQGSINFLWFDMDVKGVSKPDQSSIFDVCFKTLSEAGSKSPVTVSGKPTKMEVVGPNKTKIDLNSTPGFIIVE